jgi:hypothetical protein
MLSFCCFPTLATAQSNGAQPPTLPLALGGRHQGAEADGWVAVAGVRRVGAVWHLPAHRPLAGRVHLLHLLHCGGVGATGVYLPLHAAGVL